METSPSNIESFLVQSSRKLTDLLVEHIGADQDLFDEAMALVLKDEYPLSMRAAWALSFCVNKHPFLLEPHLSRVIDLLPKTQVDGVKRCMLKAIVESGIHIPEENLGLLADIAFNFVENRQEKVAIRALSLEALYLVLKAYPEFENEFIALLEEVSKEDIPGMKSKSRIIFKRIKRKA